MSVAASLMASSRVSSFFRVRSIDAFSFRTFCDRDWSVQNSGSCVWLVSSSRRSVRPGTSKVPPERREACSELFLEISDVAHGVLWRLPDGSCRRTRGAVIGGPPAVESAMPRVLLVDNYDSFTWNLAHDLGRTGADVVVRRNDTIDLAHIRALAPTHIVLSPGPGRPERPADFGVCLDILEHLVDTPILGVCLGLQGMAWHAGGRVVHAPRVMHGKTSAIRHHGRGLFEGLPNPMQVMRYHSLVVDRTSVPACFDITAETEDGLVMALAHRSRPLWGVQFHPESVGSPNGPTLVARFLALSLQR